MLSVPAAEVLEKPARRGGRRRRLVFDGRGGLEFERRRVVPTLGAERPGPRTHDAKAAPQAPSPPAQEVAEALGLSVAADPRLQ